MKKLMFTAVAVLTGAVSAATWNAGDSETELVVAAGETYTLTADDATRLGSTCLHVTGEGTVVGTADFAAFTGSIRISNGTFQHKEFGGLGSTDATHTGDLVIDGGTLESYVYGSSDWAQRDTPTVPVGMTVCLSGEGYQGKGAVYLQESTLNFARKVKLTGDALIASSNQKSLQFRFSALQQSVTSPKLTVKNTSLGFVALKEGEKVSGWEIDAVDGSVVRLESEIQPFHDSTVRLSDTSRLIVYDLGTDVNTVNAKSPYETDFYSALAFSGSADILVSGKNCPSIDAKGTCLSDDRNRFAGPVTLADSHVVSFGTDSLGVAFDGVVSGAGGFAASTASAVKAGWLRLSNAANTFAGGVAVRGTAQTDGTFLGGLSLLASGAAPVDGGAIALNNATLRLDNSISGEQAYELPSIAVTDGGEILDNLAVKTGVSAKGLTKTGTGTLVLSSPVAFSELADIQGGTLKLVADGKALRGLKMWWRTTNASSDTEIKQDDYYRGIDGDVSWAYQKWTTYGSGNNGDKSFQQGFRYEGYICIPGDEDEDVTFNFISSIWRKCYVWIDGTLVSSVSDGENDLSGGVYVGSWTRLGIAPRFTMKAGWHTIAVSMRSDYDGNCGPYGLSKYSWPSNFGIGVDWQGRCTTNSADYAKLQDPGDGSLLRWTQEESLTLPRFNGGVAFAAGTVFDLGGATTALTVPSLAGTPTIRNGALKVAANEWTLRTGDIVAAKPLTVESGSSLLFGAAGSRVSVAVSEEALAELRGETRILAWASETERPNNTFVASAALKSLGWSVTEKSDGVYLGRYGFRLIIR